MSNGALIDQSDRRPAPAEPKKEYLGGGHRRILQGGYASMGAEALEMEELGGPDLWEMMASDPFVGASTRLLMAGIMCDGLVPAPCIPEDSRRHSEAEKKEARAMTDFVIDAEMRMREMSIEESVLQVLRCGIVQGSGLAERVMSDITSGPNKGKMGYERIKPKPIRSWSFTVDAADNVLGISGWILKDRAYRRSTLPRDKFAVLSWDAQDGRPWGRSAYREAQPIWNLLIQTFPLYWDYLEQFANPYLVGECGVSEEPEEELDDDDAPTGQTIDPIDRMGRALEGVRGGSWIALANGGKAYLLQPAGNGEQFKGGIDTFGRLITFSILGSARVTMEAENSSRKDGETAQDVLGLGVRMGKKAVSRMVRRDLYRPLIELNFGEEKAAMFTPNCSMGDTEHQDFSRNAGAVARLMASRVLVPGDRAWILRFLFGSKAADADPTPPDPAPVNVPFGGPGPAPAPQNPPAPKQPPSPAKPGAA